jgi:hypothetical protein
MMDTTVGRLIVVTVMLMGVLGMPGFVGMTRAADLDVPAALKGQWAGTTEVQSPRYVPSRVLALTNVRPEPSTAAGVSKWKADGTYGVTADKVARVAVDITVVDTTVTVEFVTPEALHVTLKLVKPNVLEGTHVTSGGRANRMHLERRE